MSTITEDFVSFDTAKLLKEKSFDEMTDMEYNKYGELLSNRMCGYTVDHHYCVQHKGLFPYPAPSLQMAMKWLREVHNLFVFLFPQMNTNKFWAEIYRLSDNQEWENLYCESIDLQDYSTYEEAHEAAIKYCLENLI